jgi:pimeloyl-ACP methyl ester carboxylesterase
MFYNSDAAPDLLALGGFLAKAVVDSKTFEYEVIGRGRPVVLIHGALIADAFRPLLGEPSLASRYQLITYHRRGYAGSSPASGPVSVLDQAQDCRDLLRHVGVQRAHVVGHSFGGSVALQLALDAPEVVHTLALLEPALMIGTSAQAYRDSLAKAIQHFRETSASVVVDEMLQARWPEYRAALESVLPGAFDAAVAAASAAFEAELPGLLEWNFGEEEAKRITQPVLSVLGGKSVTLSPRFAEAHHWLLANCSHAEEYELPGAHHFLQMENSGDMAEALASFFERHPLAT